MHRLISAVFIGLLTVSSTLAQIEPAKCESYDLKITKCNEGRNLSSPVRYFTDIFFSAVNGNNCGNLQSDFKQVAGCVLDVTRNCGSGEFPTLYPTEANLYSGIDYSCKNIKDISLECLPGPNISICVRAKQTETGINTTVPTGDNFEDSKSYYCSANKFLLECMKELPVATGCQKTNTHLIEIMKNFKPETCGAMKKTTTFILILTSLLFSFSYYNL